MSGAISHTQRLPLASARVRPRFLTPCTARFTRSIRQLERENAKLLQRLTLLLHQGGWRAAAAPTAADARKWRHKYMVELLRRASLERRNMQLARQASRLSPHDVAVPPAEVRPLLWDPWDDPGELHELTLPRALARPRLAHLDLAGR